MLAFWCLFDAYYLMLAAYLVLVIWCLVLIWCLSFGAWCLPKVAIQKESRPDSRDS